MKFSVFTVQMPEYEPEEVYRELKSLGFDGIEWRVATVPTAFSTPPSDKSSWYWNYNKATLDICRLESYTGMILDWTGRYGIEPVSLATYLTPDQSAEIEKVLKVAKSAGFRMIRAFPPRYDCSASYTSLFSKARKELASLEKLAGDYSVEINLEIHMDTIIPSASAAARLLEGFNPRLLGVIYDPGNMVLEGYENYKMGMEMLGAYLHHIHIKDAEWVFDVTGGKKYKAAWCRIGEGAVDFDALFDAVRSVGYDRYISFEDFSIGQSCRNKLENGLMFVKKKLLGGNGS